MNRLPTITNGLATAVTLSSILVIAACTDKLEKNLDLLPQSSLNFKIGESESSSTPMAGFVDFNERVEISPDFPTDRCEFASYEFRFEYDASVYVEFRQGLNGHCSYGAVLVKSFDVKVLAEEEFPLNKPFDPFIQFQQRNAHSGVLQIGTAYFNVRVSDLRTVEILCRGESCAGSVIRRQSESTSANAKTG